MPEHPNRREVDFDEPEKDEIEQGRRACITGAVDELGDHHARAVEQITGGHDAQGEGSGLNKCHGW